MRRSTSATLLTLAIAGALSTGSASAAEQLADLRWSELSPATSPSARLGPAMAYDPVSGKVVLFGGYDDASGHRGDTWTFDGTTWVEVTPPLSPPPRAAARMAFDSPSGRIVLFGGFDGGSWLGDTWLWDGATGTWSEPPTRRSPPPVTSPQLFTDPRSGHVVEFGGYDGSRYQDETWKWTDAGWDRLSPATSPSARSAAIAGVDPVRKTVVMFGGIADVNPWNTWEWNGVDWTLQSPTVQPLNRYDSGAAFCPQIGAVVLFGGGIGIGDTHDTWVWTGSDWHRLHPDNLPGVREAFGFAFDEAIGKIVLFGGLRRDTLLDDTWVLESR